MRGVADPLTQDDEILGPVRFCFGCNEWWPSDAEFWRPDKQSRRAVCRACSDEGRRRSSRRAKTLHRSSRDDGQAA